MNATERREVMRAKTLILAGDRAGAVAALRRLERAPARSPFATDGQLVMPFMVFRCDRLDGELVPVHVCIARQAASDIQRTKQTSRGQGTEHPSCQTHLCAQGRAIRAAVDPLLRITWRGAGPGGRFTRERQDAATQEATKERLRVAGLLDEVRTIDSGGEAVEDEG